MRTLDDILKGEMLEDVLLKARLDPAVFFKRILGYGEEEGTYELKDFHIEWFNTFLHNKRSVIVAPRGFGKSEVLGVGFFLYVALFMKDKQMLIVSKTDSMAKELVSRVRNTINNNELLLTLKPASHELVWTKNRIMTNTGCVLFSKTYNENVRTWHVHYILCDEAALYEDKSVFYSAILPMVNTYDGNLMVISTPRTFVDLVAELSKKPMYVYKHYSAYKDYAHKIPLWPERFPHKKLQEIRAEQGDLKFATEYLCKPMTSETAVIPPQLIERACDESRVMSLDVGDIRNKLFVFSADFAMAAKGNYSVFLLGEVEKGKLIIRWMERPLRGTSKDVQIDTIKRIHSMVPFQYGICDNGSFGRIIVEELQAMGLPIDGIDFQNKKDDLIIDLRKAFEANKIVIPTNTEDAYTKKMSDILIKELSELGQVLTKTGKITFKGMGSYDDAAMALAMLVRACNVSGYMESYKSDAKGVFL